MKYGGIIMRKSLLAVLCVCLAAMFLVACGQQTKSTTTQQTNKTLTVYSPHPLDFINPIVKEFTDQTGIKVEIVAAGAGELLKRVEAESNNPVCDVQWGGSRVMMLGYTKYFEPFTSKSDANIIPTYKVKDNVINPNSALPTVLMYNKKLVSDADAPKSWADLLDSKWKGKIACADPSKSGSSLEALSTMLLAKGRDNGEGWEYVKKLVANLDGKLLAGSSNVYKGVADGEYAVGITFEEIVAKYIRNGAPVGIVYPAEGTVIDTDCIAIIKGAKNMENAKIFVDFVLSKNVQTKIAQDLDRRSVRDDVGVAAGLKQSSEFVTIKGDPFWVADHKKEILDKFKDIVINTK